MNVPLRGGSNRGGQGRGMVRNTPIVSNFGGGQSSHTINSAPTVVHSDRSFLTSTTALPTAETILGSDLGDEATTAHLLVRLMNFYIGPVARNLIQLVAQMENHAERLRHIESLIIPLIVAPLKGRQLAKGLYLYAKVSWPNLNFFPPIPTELLNQLVEKNDISETLRLSGGTSPLEQTICETHLNYFDLLLIC